MVLGTIILSVVIHSCTVILAAAIAVQVKYNSVLLGILV